MIDFVFDKENHLGYYKGKLVPSITQLLEIGYPLGNIKKEVLEKASEYGTSVHDDIEKFNDGFIDNCETIEGRNYAKIVDLMGLKVDDAEKQVFVFDKGEMVCYGRFDILFKATNETYFPLNSFVMVDIKTVSQFDNEKVSWQTSAYSLAYEQMFDYKIPNVAGIWVRDSIVQVRPLVRHSNDDTLEQLKEWRKVWEERQ